MWVQRRNCLVFPLAAAVRLAQRGAHHYGALPKGVRIAGLRDGARTVEDMGHPAVLVVSPVIRGWLSKAVRFRVNDLTVLSYSEIPDDQSVKVIHTVDAKAR